jgi:threonine aldolase
MIGGRMRQAGVIAAAGLVALRTGVERLAEDHRRARVLAEGLAAIPGITLDLRAVQINTVRFDVGGLGMSADQFIVAMAAHGIRISGGYGRTRASMMLHRHIDDAAVEQALAAAQLVARGGQAAKQTSTLATWSSAS